VEKFKVFALEMLTMVWAFVAPIHGIVFAVGTLVILDFITGISKAIKADGVKAINSRRMRETVGKGLLYMIAVLAAFLLDYVTGLGMAARAVAGVIAVVETKSILENVESMTGVSVLQVLVDKLKPSKLESPPESKSDDKPST
jgi:phage-related holin